MSYVARTAQRFMPVDSVIDAGGRNINGSPRLLFPGSTYLVIDLEDGPGVDVVADARHWRPESPVELVLSLEVLEHTPDHEPLLRAAWDYLMPGGRLIVTCATDPRAAHSGHDGGPLHRGEYYANVDDVALKNSLDVIGFVDLELEIHRDRGDLYATAVKA
jgi:SAM-dependent methyltransferase